MASKLNHKKTKVQKKRRASLPYNKETFKQNLA